MNALIILLFVVVIAGAAAVSFYLKQKRRDELAVFAGQQGLQYSADDVVGLIDPSFHLFQMGDGRGSENVLWGTWQGLPLAEGDYWYYTESTDGQGHRTRTYHHFSVVEVQLEQDLFLPSLSITHENLLTELADHLGFRDIDFESEDFNRMFNVRGQDREFAFKLIDARMMAWLLSTGGEFGFEIAGGKVLAYCRRLPPTGLIPIIGSAKAFHDHIPKLVWTEYASWGKGTLPAAEQVATTPAPATPPPAPQPATPPPAPPAPGGSPGSGVQ
ncbi:MAG TPA: hypothetical protein VEM41_13185 [Actinomycetota bacterium]|nr:hypothetical protein [Actinomycetota bacterium]